jgi:hypothetical protein
MTDEGVFVGGVVVNTGEGEVLLREKGWMGYPSI